jgi:hypothetical protein
MFLASATLGFLAAPLAAEAQPAAKIARIGLLGGNVGRLLDENELPPLGNESERAASKERLIPLEKPLTSIANPFLGQLHGVYWRR